MASTDLAQPSEISTSNGPQTGNSLAVSVAVASAIVACLFLSVPRSWALISSDGASSQSLMPIFGVVFLAALVIPAVLLLGLCGLQMLRHARCAHLAFAMGIAFIGQCIFVSFLAGSWWPSRAEIAHSAASLSLRGEAVSTAPAR